MKIAAIQPKLVGGLFNEKNVPHALNLLENAAKMEIDIACFPDGYPSTGEKELCEKARDLGIYLVASIRKKSETNKHYNEAILIGTKGEILGRHRKTTLCWLLEPELVQPGEGLNVVKINLGNMGILKCVEILYPEPATILTLKGADIIFVQANFLTNLIEFWHRTLLVRSWENWIPIVAVNTAKWRKRGYIYEDKELNIHYGGKSVIIAPENWKNIEDFIVRPFNGGIFYSKKRMRKAIAGYGEEIIFHDIDLNLYTQFRKSFLKNRRLFTEKL